MRRATFDRVSGRLQLAFAWDVSARGLLVLRLRALEHVLQQRKEILCMLKPISPRDALHWSHDRDAGGKRKHVSDCPPVPPHQGVVCQGVVCAWRTRTLCSRHSVSRRLCSPRTGCRKHSGGV